MGAAGSTQKSSDNKSLTKVIDFIATNYILTQNFTDMKNLANLDYCNNLVVMTADIIAKKLNESDIRYLAQRIKDGVEINEMVDEKVIYLKKSDVPELDIKNETQKRRVCIGIAKHYIMIAHLFAAIVTTINPIYTYKDNNGSTVRTTLMHKQSIPKGTQTSIKKFNICTQRLNALINNQDFNVAGNQVITVKPKFCDMNYDRVRGRDKNLNEEPGIPELEKLYYDKYDDDNGGFKGMTLKTRTEVYEKDVERFYKAYTGNAALPTNPDGTVAIKKFSQIPLRDYHRSKGCSSTGVYNKSYSGNIKDKLFGDYAQHIKTMMNTAEENQNKLIEILDEIFVISKNPDTGRKEIVINPALTEALLSQSIVKTRNIIVDLYIKCEDDFVKGLELFEAIVEKQIMDTSKEQIAVLEKTIQDSIASDTEEKPTTVGPDEEGPVQQGALNEPEVSQDPTSDENISLGIKEKDASAPESSSSSSSLDEDKAPAPPESSSSSAVIPPQSSSSSSSSSSSVPSQSSSSSSSSSNEVDTLKKELDTARKEVEDIKEQQRAAKIAQAIVSNTGLGVPQVPRSAYVDDKTGNILHLDENNNVIEDSELNN